MSEQGEAWRISENPPDGLNPFRFRILGGEGRETRPVAMFMHLTDAENCIADHDAARQRDLAVSALQRSAEWQIACLRSNAYTPSVDRDEAAAVWRECAQALAAIDATQPENASKENGQ